MGICVSVIAKATERRGEERASVRIFLQPTDLLLFTLDSRDRCLHINAGTELLLQPGAQLTALLFHQSRILQRYRAGQKQDVASRASLYGYVYVTIPGGLRWAGLTWNQPVNWLHDTIVCLCMWPRRFYVVDEPVHACACLATNGQVHMVCACLWHRRLSIHTRQEEVTRLTLRFPGPLSGGTQSAESEPGSPVSSSQVQPKLSWCISRGAMTFSGWAKDSRTRVNSDCGWESHQPCLSR